MEHSKPKKPLNAYFAYRQEWLKVDNKQNPTAEFKDRTERYNAAWQSIDPKKKEKFENTFKKENE